MEKMRWYCQVYRFQIMEKHIDSIKWKKCAGTVNSYTTSSIPSKKMESVYVPYPACVSGQKSGAPISSDIPTLVVVR